MGKDTKSKSKDKDKDTSKSESASSSKLKGGQSINVRHILSEKHASHLLVLEALSSGTDFGTVARSHSADKARQGGSLGWKTKGSLDPEFEKVAYGLEVSSTVKPVYGEVKTAEGYHVVMVEGRK